MKPLSSPVVASSPSGRIAGTAVEGELGIPDADGRPLLRPLPIQFSRTHIPASAARGSHPRQSEPRSSRPG